MGVHVCVLILDIHISIFKTHFPKTAGYFYYYFPTITSLIETPSFTVKLLLSLLLATISVNITLIRRHRFLWLEAVTVMVLTASFLFLVMEIAVIVITALEEVVLDNASTCSGSSTCVDSSLPYESVGEPESHVDHSSLHIHLLNGDGSAACSNFSFSATHPSSYYLPSISASSIAFITNLRATKKKMIARKAN